jgi:hypothetical protein
MSVICGKGGSLETIGGGGLCGPSKNDYSKSEVEFGNVEPLAYYKPIPTAYCELGVHCEPRAPQFCWAGT